MDFFNNELIKAIDIEKETSQKAFPWIPIEGVLTEEGFKTLYRDFPPIELFQYHKNLMRAKTGQRPHDRYYAAYQATPYPDIVQQTGKGLLQHQDLPQSWQQFIKEIITNRVYHQFVHKLLGAKKYGINIAWHVGIGGNEVSPHLDAKRKLGTHLIYFNTSDDWAPEWGGEFLVLENRTNEVENPEVTDFEKVTSVPIIENRSLIFKNTEEAWHGVHPLRCPEGCQRRLVNIVFSEPPKQN